MGQIKHYNISYINLTAGVIFEHNLVQPSNLVYVRNPSAVGRILFGDDFAVSATRYQVYADVDGAGAFVRPDKFNRIYLFSTIGIDRVTIEEYEVDDPAMFIIQASKGVASDVNVLSCALPAGAATQATLALILTALTNQTVTLTHSIGTAGLASSAMLAANVNRKWALLINDSDTPIYMKVNAAAVLNEGILINPGGSFEMSAANRNLSTAAINGIASAAGKNVCVTEGV